VIDVRPATVGDVPAMVDLHTRVAAEGLWDAILMALVLDDSSPGSPHPDRSGLGPGLLG
jgi:hypothetical protein